MPYADADGVKLYYEEAGSGTSIVFVHEFATDHRGWEPQMRYFARRYRCVAFNARGYPPSDVPEDPEAYSQQIATDDIAHVMRHLGLEKAHIVGLSMGGNATLQFGLDHAEMALSLVVAGGGYGSIAENTEQFRADARGMAERYETEGARAVAAVYAQSASRVQFRDKDPRGWAQFREILENHDARGAALTMRGVQARRPSFWEFEDRLRRLTVPLLVVSGDEDDWCLDASLYLKRTAPSAALWVLPKTGHTINLEEADAFNRGLQDFFDTVEAGRWISRDLDVLGKSAFFSGEE
ncbi:MAG: alpha/beta hydrolase [Rhodospirillales bacterium]|nr:MAG: alpha/beta hydrolase [Rhodospirillales bacterium]